MYVYRSYKEQSDQETGSDEIVEQETGDAVDHEETADNADTIERIMHDRVGKKGGKLA